MEPRAGVTTKKSPGSPKKEPKRKVTFSARKSLLIKNANSTRKLGQNQNLHSLNVVSQQVKTFSCLPSFLAPIPIFFLELEAGSVRPTLALIESHFFYK